MPEAVGVGVSALSLDWIGKYTEQHLASAGAALEHQGLVLRQFSAGPEPIELRMWYSALGDDGGKEDSRAKYHYEPSHSIKG